MAIKVTRLTCTSCGAQTPFKVPQPGVDVAKYNAMRQMLGGIELKVFPNGHPLAGVAYYECPNCGTPYLLEDNQPVPDELRIVVQAGSAMIKSGGDTTVGGDVVQLDKVVNVNINTSGLSQEAVTALTQQAMDAAGLGPNTFQTALRKSLAANLEGKLPGPDDVVEPDSVVGGAEVVTHTTVVHGASPPATDRGQMPPASKHGFTSWDKVDEELWAQGVSIGAIKTAKKYRPKT